MLFEISGQRVPSFASRALRSAGFGLTLVVFLALNGCGRSGTVSHRRPATQGPDVASLAGVAVDRRGNVYSTGVDTVIRLLPHGKFATFYHKSGFIANTLATDSKGNVYATTGEEILKLSPKGKPIARMGGSGSGPGRFTGLDQMAIDGVGNIYAADQDNQRVQKLSPAGKVLAVWTAKNSFFAPEGVALDSRGNLFVSDVSPSPRIVKLSGTGKVLASWGGSKRFPAVPSTLAIDGRGYLYAADLVNNDIAKFSPAGRLLATFNNTPGTLDAALASPEQVAADLRGDVYVADSRDPTSGDPDRIVEFSPGGSVKATWSGTTINVGG